jgi:hypothetical protein
MELAVVAPVAAVGLADMAVNLLAEDEAEAVVVVLMKRRRIQGITLRRNGRSYRMRNVTKFVKNVTRKASKAEPRETFQN